MICCPSCGISHDTTDPVCVRCGYAPQTIDGFSAWAPELATHGGGFKAEYFSELATLEANNFWFRSRNSLIQWAVDKYFPQCQSLLEIGCGTGFVLAGLSKHNPTLTLTGSEIFTNGLKFAAQRVPSANFAQMDARALPYIDEFDIVAAFDVIEHIEEDQLVLNNLFSATKPGGGILITVPQHQWLWSAADDYACHQRRYDKKNLHSKIRSAGFKIIRSTSFVSLLLPAMILSRKRSKIGQNFDPLDEFRINPIINSVLEKVLNIERSMIRLGVNLPIGGSHLIVAFKNEQQ